MGRIIKQLPNALTLANMLLGLTAITMLIRTDMPGKEWIAAALILAGAAADCLDGYLARKLNIVTGMGKQLDSFADFVTFGIAPVCLAHHLMPFETPVLIGASFLFPAAGAYRLARHNLKDCGGCFVGLPITAAGILMTVYAVAYAHWGPHCPPGVCGVVTILFIALLSVLMVSRVRMGAC